MRLAAKKDTPPQTAKTAAKKKLGFPVPIRVWLKEDKYYSIVRERFESDEANRFSTPKSWCICWTITVQARQTTAGKSGHCICSWYGTRSISGGMRSVKERQNKMASHVTYAYIRQNPDIREYIRRADMSLAAIGYTEHSFAHVERRHTMRQ